MGIENGTSAEEGGRVLDCDLSATRTGNEDQPPIQTEDGCRPHSYGPNTNYSTGWVDSFEYWELLDTLGAVAT